MKVGARCGFCLLHRGYQQILRATDDEEIRKETIGALLKLIGEMYDLGETPAIIGSERDRVIHRITGCSDPYEELKRQANAKALEMLPGLEKMVESAEPSEKFRTACLVACLGNVIEYDVPDHSADIDDVLVGISGDGFYFDDLDEFRGLLGPEVDVLYLTDNAGEIVFDILVVRELRALGCRVTVAVKGGPSINDALMGDAVDVGMVDEADKVITTGTDAVGINLSEASDEFIEAFNAADVILSKGMANWETLTEYEAPCPVLFLLRTKCEPVAVSIGAPLGVNVAKLVPMGWKL